VKAVGGHRHLTDSRSSVLSGRHASANPGLHRYVNRPRQISPNRRVHCEAYRSDSNTRISGPGCITPLKFAIGI
jgi:hypothetical protein